MDDVCGVKSFQCTEGLIDEVLSVIIGEVLGSNDTVHVGFHEFLDNYKPSSRLGVESLQNNYWERTVYFLELLYRRRFDDIQNRDNLNCRREVSDIVVSKKENLNIRSRKRLLHSRI